MISIMIVAALLIIFLLTASYICFRVVFYVPDHKKKNSDDVPLPQGKIYEVFWEDMRKWVLETRQIPHEDMSIISFDGLQLYGKYFEYSPGAPIELMFHGYRGCAERDLSGGVQRCFQLERSALIVDQRCAGRSEGNVITFGIKEHRDCLTWIDYMIEHFGPDVKIILTGISMGASTVLIASGCDLPKNVIGILADCGFHSAKDVILHVAHSMKLPGKLLYPFIKLGARLFGHFDLDAFSPEKSLGRSKIPVLFFHGEADDYVPCEMSKINYEACNSRKKLILIPDAGHGLSYLVAPERYLKETSDFFYCS